jgi:hypothetical protein
MTDRIVISSDHQARYDDRETEQAFLYFLEDWKPQTAVLNGDLVDLQALGKYRASLDERKSLMPDVEAATSILKNEKSALPKKTRMVLTAGNHEERLANYLLDRAAELENVPGLAIETLLGLDKLGVEYVGPYGAGIDWHSVFIYHGTRVTKGAAAQEMADRWTSGVSGHTQRLGDAYYTDGMGENHGWYEDGCMCRVDPEGAPPSVRGPKQNNWQQGFVIGEYIGSKWSMTTIHIGNHEFVYNGNLYTPKGVK